MKNAISDAFEPSDRAKSQQCAVVFAALQQGPKTTRELRALGVMSPASRVLDLRRAGVFVATMRHGGQAEYRLREVQP